MFLCSQQLQFFVSRFLLKRDGPDWVEWVGCGPVVAAILDPMVSLQNSVVGRGAGNLGWWTLYSLPSWSLDGWAEVLV